MQRREGVLDSTENAGPWSRDKETLLRRVLVTGGRCNNFGTHQWGRTMHSQETMNNELCIGGEQQKPNKLDGSRCAHRRQVVLREKHQDQTSLPCSYHVMCISSCEQIPPRELLTFWCCRLRPYKLHRITGVNESFLKANTLNTTPFILTYVC